MSVQSIKIYFIFVTLLSIGCQSIRPVGEVKNAKENPTKSQKTVSPSIENAPGITPLQTTLSVDEKKIAQWLTNQEKEMKTMLKQLVEINSSTRNPEGLSKVRDILQKELISLGFETKTVDGGKVNVLTCEGGEIEFADHLVASKKGEKGKRVLISGHMDTVFPIGNAFNTYLEKGDIATGPGVADMKGGLVIMIFALKALKQFGLLEPARFTILLNTDEEMGSLGSRTLIEELAKKHDVGLVFESSFHNKLVHSRKGLGQVRLKVTGRSSHAGGAHHEGVSAIRELSHKVIELENLTNYEDKVTVNVGLIQGGEARNTVPPCAEAYIDLRYPDNQLAKKLTENIEAIVSKQNTYNQKISQGPKSEHWLVLHRPAKPRAEESDLLVSKVMGISEALGVKLETRYSGGGTDGSIMQAAGLPTMDSLGIDGSGAHSPREQADLTSLVHRSQLASVLLMRLIIEK